MANLGEDIVPPIVSPLENGKPVENAVTVNIQGQSFFGWKSVNVERSLRSICHSFEISLDDKFDAFASGWPLRPDVEVKIGIGSEQVFTGLIEVVQPRFGAEGRSFVISGRSKAADIVDCEYEGPTEFNKISLDKFAEKLVKPFGLKVFLSVVPSELSNFVIKPGETVFEAIDRAARIQGFLWVSTRGGNIRLTRIGRGRAFSSLEQDINVLDGSATYDSSKRYSKYTVKGQSGGLEDFFGKAAAQPVGTARDNGVKRNRPKTILAEGSVNAAQAKKRAEWEASVRLAETLRIAATTDSWRQEDGSLWGYNQIVKFKSTFLGVNDDFLIDTISYSVDESSAFTTTLGLTDPQAYDPQPVVNKTSNDDVLARLGL